MRRAVPTERVDLTIKANGLSQSEVERRLTVYGPNAIAEALESGFRQLALDTLKDPMLWFLLVAAGLFVATGEWREAIVLVVAIIPLTGMDAFLHWRTAASTKSLHSRLSATALVIRDGQQRQIPARELVPGDIAVVHAGDYFPADGIVVECKEAQCDESPLTGESLPIAKAPLDSLPQGAAPLVDGKHWGFAGTKVLTGHAVLAVASTGAETLYGEIIGSVTATSHAQTPLQQAIGRLVKRLLLIATGFCAILASARLAQGKGIVDAVVSAATLAVAAIPEEFPVVFTFFLGVGVYRMARRKALVRRAVSVENIGRVTCICSDKTGTLTEGQLRLAHVLPATGSDERDVRLTAGIASRHESMDPIDQAILEGAEGASESRRVATFPFTESRRRETTVIDQSGTVLVATKGAPEVIFAMTGLPISEIAAYREAVSRLAQEGHKVLACASSTVPATEWQGSEPEAGYRLIGLLAFEDPARPEVPAAIKACRAAGIHVLMVTGDHPDTAGAIAREIGLGGDSPQVYSAEDEDFASRTGDLFASIDVVARAMPSQKLAIVKALQARGAIVAVTGDGINDVPALQAADIGVAMGERGTRSAREVASIVLSDDNFASVVAAVAEGRQLLENLRRSFKYLLMVHIPLVTTAALLPLLGSPLLYLPIHIVWLELVIHPTAMLAFQEQAAARLSAQQGKVGADLLKRADWVEIGAVGFLTTVAVMTLFLWCGLPGEDLGAARALAIATLVISSALSAAMLNRLRTRAAWITLVATLVSAVLLTEVPVLAQVLHLSPPSITGWLYVIAAAAGSALLPVAANYVASRLSLGRRKAGAGEPTAAAVRSP